MNNRYVEATEDTGVVVLKVLPEQLREAEVCYAVRDQMVAAVDPGHTGRVVIDLGNVNFVGSIGLLAFLAVRRSLAEGRIVICNLDDSIRDMLVLCQLISTEGASGSPFETRSTLAEALVALAE